MTAQEVLKMALDCGVMIKVQGDNLRLDAKQAPPNRLLAEIKQHKSELLTLLAANDHDSNRYAHLITCQQCEHLTSTGHCSVKTQYKPQPEAMRDCASFEKVAGERVAIANAPYSVTELNDLLNRYEKKLFHHLVDCVACSFMDSRYCVDAFAIGSSYDAMLLVFDDAASKREALLNAVIRARISPLLVLKKSFDAAARSRTTV
jgi:hypothetical protein